MLADLGRWKMAISDESQISRLIWVGQQDKTEPRLNVLLLGQRKQLAFETAMRWSISNSHCVEQYVVELELIFVILLIYF